MSDPVELAYQVICPRCKFSWVTTDLHAAQNMALVHLKARTCPKVQIRVQGEEWFSVWEFLLWNFTEPPTVEEEKL